MIKPCCPLAWRRLPVGVRSPVRPPRVVHEEVWHGVLQPGVYRQRFWSAAAWAALPPADRPAQATFVRTLGGYQALVLVLAWPSAGPPGPSVGGA